MLETQAQNFKAMKNTEEDSLVIKRALEDFYFKGIYEGDIETLKKILHPGTLLFGDVKGQPYAKTLDTYLDGVQNRQSPMHTGSTFQGSIDSIEVINSIAIARVHVKMYAFNYDELLSFHKIGNQWMIVNKMLTDVESR